MLNYEESDLEIDAECRICVVEVEGQRKLLTACSNQSVIRESFLRSFKMPSSGRLREKQRLLQI